MTRQRPLGSLVLTSLLVAAGCVTNQPWIANHEAAPAVCQVHAFWDGRIQETQDIVNGGQPLHGLAGRIYLFGPDLGLPLKGEGTVSVDLYDVTNAPPGAQAAPLERWQFDPVTLKNLLRKDRIGWGYTLFLPWSTNRPDIARVQLKVCYTPVKGTPLYAEPTSINIRNQTTLTQTRQVVSPNGVPVSKQ